nr:OmpA family protein [uncultured Mucilaginibacter sp.]
MIKHLTLAFIACCINLQLFAQSGGEKKPSTLVLNVFYNDFKTAQQIRNTSLSSVLKNNQWSKIGEMQSGFGVSYLKGLHPRIDLVTSVGASFTDYLYKNGASNGSDEFLLDANAGFNFKLLTDRHSVVPYLSAGVGGSLYKGSKGAYVPLGAGLQFNMFKAAWVFTQTQYRVSLSPAVNYHFQYSLGIGVSIGKHKKEETPVVSPVIVAMPVKVDTTPIAIPVKNVIVSVTDQQTGLSLPGVTIYLDGPGGKKQGETDNNGKVIFNATSAADYMVSGSLNGIATTTRQLTKNGFNNAQGSDLPISISHNDPRFTLAGKVINKNTSQPETGVVVNAINIAQNKNAEVQNQADGSFNMQLDAGSDFSISGKKGGYISNIEKVTTKGLTRSATLYVKLELAVEQAVQGRAITLSNIYYDTNSIILRPEALADLEKLAGFLKDNPTARIEIASHTDSRGNAAKNQKLSQARALGVANYLVAHGIEKSRLIARGFGATKLVNGCKVGVSCTATEHAKNRRTEFKVL